MSFYNLCISPVNCKFVKLNWLSCSTWVFQDVERDGKVDHSSLFIIHTEDDLSKINMSLLYICIQLNSR